MSGTASPELCSQLEKKIELGKILVDKVAHLKCVRGIDKLKRKIHQEVNFLLKISKNQSVKKEHLICTNLNHFEAVVDCLLNCSAPTAVLQSYTLVDEHGEEYKKIVVDIVCYEGKRWIKVVARNPRALTQLSCGNGQYGQRSVLDQVEDYKRIAQQHPYVFKPPEIIFHFASGVESVLVNHIKAMGITISGFVIEVVDGAKQDLAICSLEPVDKSNNEPESTSTQTEVCCNDFMKACKTLNLDVTTLLAYVSSLTNSSSGSTMKCVYKNALLNLQAECDKVKPVKPLLDKLFKDKKLICCQSAAASFNSIVSQVGGPNEKLRAKDLMTRVEIIPDCESPAISNRVKPGGRIRPRSLTVFSTGHNVQAVTVSANEGFVRAAANQGVKFTVFLHPARALSEKKLLPQENTPEQQEFLES